MSDSLPTGAVSVLFEPTKSEGTATKPIPDNKSALSRRVTLAGLPRDARTTIAFLDAEEQMLELRLSRRRGGDQRYPIEARRELRDKRDILIQYFERTNPANIPIKRQKGTGASHPFGN